MLESKALPLYFLVGKNGCGKSYVLREFLRNNSYTVLIDEEGLPNFSTSKKSVKIDYAEWDYIFQNEENRGLSEELFELEKIQPNIINAVNYANDVKKKLSIFKTKSRGQEKLYNLMSIFTDYSFNNVEYICFDEPENYLDEDFIKVIGKFVKILIQNNFCVRIATHSVRLLSELKADLKEVILFNNFKMNQLSLEDIKGMFRETKNKIESIRKRDGYNEDANIRSKLNIDENEIFFRIFLEQTLKSENFYRCLFNETIVIVEGESEVIALQNIKTKFETSVEIYSPYGKAHIPFFTKLFLSINKRVVVVIDEDTHSEKHPIVLTKYLTEIEAQLQGLKLIIHAPDLENFYGIDLQLIASEIGMSKNASKINQGWLKTLSSMIFFEHEENRMKLEEYIWRKEEDYSFEFE
ncbi:hypothetical protein CR203_18275 [Salipaludibacillus neizhouensis]|uniref:Uncharacterized protein n=1 Tax=Salipaludibacillus neizhouensis TaxID=885475 RepID=A0A3A9K096_9BACI|nr:TOPRIM nucleotidyl transferase/hydrolase domain-containing protein [Salipaludibacillus neizhouensis]RKL65809.1 hypothetical protein CR203_18275 [Salipaludibacillus neizhouensis]